MQARGQATAVLAAGNPDGDCGLHAYDGVQRPQQRVGELVVEGVVGLPGTRSHTLLGAVDRAQSGARGRDRQLRVGWKDLQPLERGGMAGEVPASKKRHQRLVIVVRHAVRAGHQVGQKRAGADQDQIRRLGPVHRNQPHIRTPDLEHVAAAVGVGHSVGSAEIGDRPPGIVLALDLGQKVLLCTDVRVGDVSAHGQGKRSLPVDHRPGIRPLGVVVPGEQRQPARLGGPHLAIIRHMLEVQRSCGEGLYSLLQLGR